jgi:hypothetical protein
METRFYYQVAIRFHDFAQRDFVPAAIPDNLAGMRDPGHVQGLEPLGEPLLGFHDRSMLEIPPGGILAALVEIAVNAGKGMNITIGHPGKQQRLDQRRLLLRLRIGDNEYSGALVRQE